MRTAVLLPIPALLVLATGCRARCDHDDDCALGSHCGARSTCEVECTSDLDCRVPPACEANPTLCPPVGHTCSLRGRCVEPEPRREPEGSTLPWVEPGRICDGGELPPGSGLIFIVDSWAVAGALEGFDVDGQGGPDNALAFVGQFGNDLIRTGVRDGTTLVVLEIVGLDDGVDDDDISVRFYRALDTDADARNNFASRGSGECCRFDLDPTSLSGGRPVSQACARLSRGRIETVQPFSFLVSFPVGDRPQPVLIDRARFSARLNGARDELTSGLLGGAVPVHSLADAKNIYCQADRPQLCTADNRDARIVELLASLGSRAGPDIDLDTPRDGLDCVRLDSRGRIDLCCESARDVCLTSDGTCVGATVPPVDPGDPASCTAHPAMNDGYSVALELHAVPAALRRTAP